MSRPAIYGKVKAAVFKAQEMGLTVNEAAELFGFKKRSIRSSADVCGVKLRPMRRRHGSVKALVIKANAQGLTAREAADLCGVTPYTIYATARRMGIGMRPAYGKVTT